MQYPKNRKKFAIWASSHNFVGVNLPTKARIDNRKPAARGSLQIQDANKVAKNRHLGTLAQLRRAISLQIRHISTIGKKTC